MRAINRHRSSTAGRLTPLAAALAVLGLVATACSTTEDLADSPVADDQTDPGSESVDAPANLDFTVDVDLLEDPPELAPEQVPILLEPEEQLPELETETAVLEQAVESPDVEILEVADLLDDGPTAEEIESFGDGHTRNSTGELVVLDEPASLACADTQIALVRLDESRSVIAAGHVASAAERASRSDLDEVVAWSEALSGAAGGTGDVDPTVLVGFLAVCIDGGYEL